jgi:hypothetical protein
VFDAEACERRETLTTERGAHTIALDRATHEIYAFLPQSHAALVFQNSTV